MPKRKTEVSILDVIITCFITQHDKECKPSERLINPEKKENDNVEND